MLQSADKVFCLIADKLPGQLICIAVRKPRKPIICQSLTAKIIGNHRSFSVLRRKRMRQSHHCGRFSRSQKSTENCKFFHTLTSFAFSVSIIIILCKNTPDKQTTHNNALNRLAKYWHNSPFSKRGGISKKGAAKPIAAPRMISGLCQNKIRLQFCPTVNSALQLGLALPKVAADVRVCAQQQVGFPGHCTHR